MPEAIAVLEITNYAKHEIEGADAAEYLDRQIGNRLLQEGRLNLTLMLIQRLKGGSMAIWRRDAWKVTDTLFWGPVRLSSQASIIAIGRMN